MDGSKVMGQKVPFLAILGRFGAFLTLFDPIEGERDFFSKIQECHILTITKLLTHEKFQKIQMDCSWEKPGHTNIGTDVPENSSPPQNSGDQKPEKALTKESWHLKFDTRGFPSIKALCGFSWVFPWK